MRLPAGEEEQDKLNEALKRNIEQPLGTEIIDKLIQNDKSQFESKRPFMKAQYHQCIPNPKKEGEMISVQLLSMWDLGFAEHGKNIK